MATNLGARKNGDFKAVCTAPSFNKTPVGSATPPLPYPTFADLSNSVNTVDNVRLNGNPIYVLSKTTQPSCKGDDAGVAKGVKSGTCNGEVKPTQASGSVRAGSKFAVRLGDTCTMNGGNNPGIYVIQPAHVATRPETAGSKPPQAAPETPAEKGFMDKMRQGFKDAAQGWKDNGSQAVHGFANSAMEKGGNIAMAGGAAAAVGGGMALTGVGAAPGAVIAAGGGATAAVGGGVTAVGGATSSVATGLDHAADYILTGKTPDFVAAGTAYAKDMAQRLVGNKIERVTNLIPGMGRKKPAGAGNNNNQQQNNNRNQQNNNQQGGGGGNGPNNGIKVKARMKPHEPKCFKKNAKGDPKEYDRQLADQEKGLNDLTVKEYLEGRERYQQIGRHGTGKAQQAARDNYSKELTVKFEKQLEKSGASGDISKQATQMAKDRMDTLAALHNPDMIAGGKDVVTTMGDKGVNSSIGSQWKDRVADMDKAAKEIPESERGDTKMNTKLKRCP
jgi:hypothetical protein